MRGGVKQEDIGYIDVSTSRKDQPALVGKETLISLVPVEMMQLRRGCPFDGLAQGLLDRAMNDNSATRVNDVVNGYANSRWSLNDSWVAEASCVGREEGMISSDLNWKTPLRSEVVLQFCRGCDDCWGSSVYVCDESTHLTD